MNVNVYIVKSDSVGTDKYGKEVFRAILDTGQVIYHSDGILIHPCDVNTYISSDDCPEGKYLNGKTGTCEGVNQIF